MLPSPSRAALTLTLGATIALPARSASARNATSTIAPSDRERSQVLLGEGDQALAAGKLETAISKYRAAYYGLTPEDQASYLGSLLIRKAMRAFDQLVSTEEDSTKREALLRRQRVILDEFLTVIVAKEGAADEVGPDVIAELTETLQRVDEALDPPSEGTTVPPREPPVEPKQTPPEVVPPPTSTAADSSDDGPSLKRDWLGLGLIIGGSTAFATGLGIGVGYFSIREGADALVDANDEYAVGTQARRDYLEGEYARAQPFLIAGSVVAGVGLATAVGGVVRLVLYRRRSRASSDPTALRLTPTLTPTAAGLTLHRRF